MLRPAIDLVSARPWSPRAFPCHRPEGNSHIERVHLSLKKEEVWTAEYRGVEGARGSTARPIAQYNDDGPHRGVLNLTPHEAFLVLATDLNSETLAV